MRYAHLKKEVIEERRLRFERRQFSYSEFIPERRSGEDRRDDSSSFEFKFRPILLKALN
jgi:hypothetical protein